MNLEFGSLSYFHCVQTSKAHSLVGSSHLGQNIHNYTGEISLGVGEELHILGEVYQPKRPQLPLIEWLKAP